MEEFEINDERMEIDLSKFGLEKTEEDSWIGWIEYLSESMNPNYGYYLRYTVHKPRWQNTNSNSLEDEMWRVIIHRHYDVDKVEDNLKVGESREVYRGMIESQGDLQFILSKTGIL